jgi:AraC-like DNA-binding protein
VYSVLLSQRYLPQSYCERDDAFIKARGWPRTLIDLALARNYQEHTLLRNTGIFYEDIINKNLLLAPCQIFRLIENLLKQPQGYELAFLAGHELFAPYQQPLAHAMDTQHFLDLLIAHNLLILPLLSAQLHYEADRLVIYWQDNFGASELMPFLLASIATAIHSFTRWRTGATLPWIFYFAHNQPAHIEQYQVHLGGQFIFNAHTNALAIARNELHRPWRTCPFSKSLTEPIPLSNETAPPGFLHELYHYLKANIHHQPSLAQCAQDFGMSSASLKRKLQKHRSSFQQQFDLVRKHLALHWLSEAGITQEHVAQQLHFYDAANLRRAFKRWTGRLPGKL